MDILESDDKADVSDSKQKLLNGFIEKTENGGASLEKYSEYAKEHQTLGELVYFV